MNFNNATFLTGAVTLNDCPKESLPEFCFAGRSNVGKSSLINKITNRKKLARTSNTPGKTQQMNYFLIDDKIYFVDLPGFGYAKVPESERKRWGKNIQAYLLNRETLKLIFHLVDSRHEPTALDEEFFYWMGENRIPFTILLAKADKISNNKIQKSLSSIKKILDEMNIEVPVIPCSAETGKGIPEIMEIVREFSIDQPINQP